MNCSLKIASLAILGAVTVGSLFAQAPPPGPYGAIDQTYVGSNGSDSYPCTHTYPCATFTGALLLTAAGGEIDALDSGDFGTVNINKAVTIVGTGSAGTIFANGSNGFLIAAGPNDKVVLRNLSINGRTSGPVNDTRGVVFTSGKTLVVDRCEISNFNLRNISIESSTGGATALITNSIVHGGLNNGIVVSSPGNAYNGVIIDNVQSAGNVGYGVAVAAGASVQIRNSVLGNNLGGGLWVAGSIVDLQSSMISNNLIGIEALSGATVRMGNSTVVSNYVGVDFPGSTISSYRDNQITGNISGNGPVSSTIFRQ